MTFAFTRRPSFAIAALAAWTLFLWTTRIRNIVSDNELAGWAKTWRLGVSVTFVGVALVLVSLLFSRSKDATLRRPDLTAALASALAIFGIGWWAIRLTQVLFDDHTAAFKIVHSVLGLGTIGFGALVLWATRPAESEFGR